MGAEVQIKRELPEKGVKERLPLGRSEVKGQWWVSQAPEFHTGLFGDCGGIPPPTGLESSLGAIFISDKGAGSCELLKGVLLSERGLVPSGLWCTVEQMGQSFL